jgi:hypothetical protein
MAWLERFWSDRDRAALRKDGERLREHYRRLLYARRHFALTISRRFYGDQDAYRSAAKSWTTAASSTCATASPPLGSGRSSSG